MYCSRINKSNLHPVSVKFSVPPAHEFVLPTCSSGSPRGAFPPSSTLKLWVKGHDQGPRSHESHRFGPRNIGKRAGTMVYRKSWWETNLGGVRRGICFGQSFRWHKAESVNYLDSVRVFSSHTLSFTDHPFRAKGKKDVAGNRENIIEYTGKLSGAGRVVAGDSFVPRGEEENFTSLWFKRAPLAENW